MHTVYDIQIHYHNCNHALTLVGIHTCTTSRAWGEWWRINAVQRRRWRWGWKVRLLRLVTADPLRAAFCEERGGIPAYPREHRVDFIRALPFQKVLEQPVPLDVLQPVVDALLKNRWTACLQKAGCDALWTGWSQNDPFARPRRRTELASVSKTCVTTPASKFVAHVPPLCRPMPK